MPGTLALLLEYSGSCPQLPDLTWPGSLEEVLLAVSSTRSSWPVGMAISLALEFPRPVPGGWVRRGKVALQDGVQDLDDPGLLPCA